MIDEFLTWESWDSVDTAAFNFNVITLKKPIGDLPAGTKFESCYVDYERGIFELYDFTESEGCGQPTNIHKFKIKLEIQPG